MCIRDSYEGGYASAGFFRTLAPVGIVISILLTILAIIGIWEKDQPKYCLLYTSFCDLHHPLPEDVL